MDNFQNENISEEFIKARDTAIKYLNYRARSRMELIRRLEEGGFGNEIIQQVLCLMEKYDYINDEKFCEMYIHDKTVLQGFGSERLTYELKSKGVDIAIIQKCLEAAELDEEGAAYKLLCKKYKKQVFLASKKKAIDFLIRKGYSYNIAMSAIKRYSQD